MGHPPNTGQGEALRIFLNDCRKLRHYEDEVLIRRSLVVWRSLAEVATVVRDTLPPGDERSVVIGLLRQAGILSSEAIVHGAAHDE